MTRKEAIAWLSRRLERPIGMHSILEFTPDDSLVDVRDFDRYGLQFHLEPRSNAHGVWLPAYSWKEVGRDPQRRSGVVK